MLKEIDMKTIADSSQSALLRAALQDGVFLVRHGISETLLNDAYGLLGKFFALPLDQKLAHRALGANGQAGYTPALVESAEKSDNADWKELFHWGEGLAVGHPLRDRFPNRYPDPILPDGAVPGIGIVLTELHAAMLDFQLKMVDLIAAALGLHSGYFREMLQDGPAVNRAAWYPPVADAPSRRHVWAVEHQDFDLITALPRATAAGLEVLVEGEWIRVSPPDGCAVVNAGMVLERLTSGAIPAVIHRVIAASGQQGPRLSILQFCHPTPWTVLTPAGLPAGVAGHRQFPVMSAGDLFDRTMYRINRLDARAATLVRA